MFSPVSLVLFIIDHSRSRLDTTHSKPSIAVRHVLVGCGVVACWHPQHRAFTEYQSEQSDRTETHVRRLAGIGYTETWAELEAEGKTEGIIDSISTPPFPSTLRNDWMLAGVIEGISGDVASPPRSRASLRIGAPILLERATRSLLQLVHQFCAVVYPRCRRFRHPSKSHRFPPH